MALRREHLLSQRGRLCSLSWRAFGSGDAAVQTHFACDTEAAQYDRRQSHSSVYRGSEAGALTALPAWNEYMATALNDIEEQATAIPEDIVSVRIDEKTGLLATKNDHTSRFEYFISGTEPIQYATIAEQPQVIDNDGQGKVIDEEEIF